MSARRTLTGVVLAAALAAGTTVAAAAPPGGKGDRPAPGSSQGLDRKQEKVLHGYAEDTWRSFTAMVDDSTGLPADNIAADLTEESRSGFTSPTNIGSYLWSTLVARDLRIIGRHEARQRMATTLSTLSEMERHEQSGMFYNWYDEATGEKLYEFPGSGEQIYPFLSSVDNGWLAAALKIVASAEPTLRKQANAVRSDMDFGFYYDPAALGEDAPAGQIRGGFWDEPPAEDQCSVEDNYRGGDDVYFTCHHYGAFNSESRIGSYMGIVDGDIPREHYFAMWRTFPNDSCDYDWTEQMAEGEWTEHLGVPVFQGTYGYRDMRLVPTWGGSMFEAMMVPMLVPEEDWGTDSWAVNHPLYVQAQIEHGLEEAGYGYWGFSPSNNPAGGYREYGVDAIGMEPEGYSSDVERTTVDYGYGDCREAQPEPEEWGQGVVTPHASFLALRHAPDEALENLANLREDFGAYADGGFLDAINVSTGEMSERYLSLDQGMVMASIGNALTGDRLREHFARGDAKRVLEPLMRVEDFGASAR